MSADDRISTPGLSRRGLLLSTGTTLSLAAVLAACGGGGVAAPGRVGNAPVPTDPPDEPVDDAVHLRTATSLEHTALDAYARIEELGVLDETGTALVARLVEDHTRSAAAMAELTTAAGGEPFECANPWWEARVMPVLFERLAGREDVAEGEEPIEPSDDPARDAMTIAYALESTLAATYQQMVVDLHDPTARAESITRGAEAARHAAAVAIARDGAPAAYVNPTLTGGEVDLEASEGVQPIYAVPARFGSLAPVAFTLGPLSDAGTRFSATLQTPAENSFVYPSVACDA